MANLNPDKHLSTIMAWSQTAKSLLDRYPPMIDASDGPVVAKYIGNGISYYFTANVFIRRQPARDELGLDIYGNPAINPYIRDRLRNEAAALRFLAANTDIPVPRVLGLWEEHGLMYLKTAFVQGAVELRDLDITEHPKALERVTLQLENEILPQLRQLRRNTLGSADPDLPVIPPRRLWRWKEDREWPSVPRDVPEYVFCHTDLDHQNIMVDPQTFRIASILDWETAGFFPQSWELPLWKTESHEERDQMNEVSRKDELLLFDTWAAS